MFSQLEWHDSLTPLVICGWLMFVVAIKLIYHRSSLCRMLPESALLILFGLLAGYILDHIFYWDLFLHPDLFFLYLLPPIALEAGFCLPFELFMRNIGTILLYAIIGTCLNILAISGLLWFFSPYYEFSIPYIDLLLFSTLISAVDPVAVISVFEEIHVNQLLYINVFGESLLNDAVVIVLYHSLAGMAKIGQENIIQEDINQALLSFSMVASGGIVIGLLFVVFTGAVTRLTAKIPSMQPLATLLIPYTCYLVCENVHMSGIIGIVTCGLMMKPYVEGNSSDAVRTTTKHFMKTISHTCESIIFLFLGLSTFSKNHQWDFIFAAVTVASCFFVRYVVVFTLTWLVNKNREKKISIKDTIIIGYGGLRGAICYGLVQTLEDDVILSKDMMITTSIIVIIFTVFIQGSTMKYLVRLLRVKVEEPHEKTITQRIMKDIFANDLMCGIESIVGVRGPQFYRRRLSAFNHNVLEPNLMVNPSSRGERLVQKVYEMNANDARRRLLETEEP